MKTKRIIYWTSTVLLCTAMLFSGIYPFIDNQHPMEEYTKLGYPTYLITFVSIAKLLAVATLLHNRWKRLTEWAYAGLFYDFILAFMAHYMVYDGEQWGVLVPMILLLTSYFYKDQVRS